MKSNTQGVNLFTNMEAAQAVARVEPKAQQEPNACYTGKWTCFTSTMLC